MNEQIIDADFNETDGVHDIRTLLPCMTVSPEILIKDLAYYNGPVELKCERDGQSNTGVRFTVSFTDAMGVEQVVTSKYIRQLMLQAAALERKAAEQKYRQRTKRGNKQRAKSGGDYSDLPVFATNGRAKEPTL